MSNETKSLIMLVFVILVYSLVAQQTPDSIGKIEQMSANWHIKVKEEIENDLTKIK